MFKEQSRKWVPLAIQFTARAVATVHEFIADLLRAVCKDDQVREALWELELWKRLRPAYARAVERTEYLLRLEREGQPFTLNRSFNTELHRSSLGRLEALLDEMTVSPADGEPDAQSTNGLGHGHGHGHRPPGFVISRAMISRLTTDKTNTEHTRELIHDILKSYYRVARERFVDNVLNMVVFGDLLDDDAEGPLGVFAPKLVMAMSDQNLQMVAGEDTATANRRERLVRDIESLKKATRVLRGGAR
jgi:hypothetical protein